MTVPPGVMRRAHNPRMTLNELRWFLVVAHLQNVSRAAQELNLSQPALSRAIRRLERTYGVELFDRSKQRMRLNSFGSALRGRVEAALTAPRGRAARREPRTSGRSAAARPASRARSQDRPLQLSQPPGPDRRRDRERSRSRS